MSQFTALHPDHALDDVVAEGPDGSRTVWQLLRDSEALAARLPSSSPGSLIALICADRYHFAAGLLAIWRAGHCAALPPNGQDETIALLTRQPHVVQLLHDTDAKWGLDVRTALGSQDWPDPQPPAAFSAATPLVTVFTSGSTGPASAHVKTAGQLLGEVASHHRAKRLQPHDLVLATVPPHHLYGLLFSVLLPLRSRAAFHRSTPLHAEAIAELARQFPRVVLVSVPAHLAPLATLAAGELATVKHVITSTAPLPESVAQALHARGIAVTAIFGSSETGGIAASEPAEGPAWRPLPGVRIAVEAPDATGAGRLLVDSPFLPPNCLGPMATQDRVRMTGPAEFVHLGRLDDVVKVGGTRVALHEIEQRLLSLPGVSDAVARAVATSGLRGQAIEVAVVAPGWQPQQLREALAKWLVPSVLPRRYAIVEKLPRDANGKLPRAAFDALFAPPTVEVEQQVWLQQKPAPDAQQWRFDVRIPAGLPAFRGHFPGYPVLPGVAQLALIVLPAQREVRPEWPSFHRLTRLKFRRVIAPGDMLELQLAVDDLKMTADFALIRESETCAAGRFHFSWEL